MTTRIAFIRGINVGGKNAVPMAELRKALSGRGFQNPRTYIQSGNVVYDPPAGAGESASTLRAEASQISEVIRETRGFAPAVMVLTAASVAKHLQNSPYASADQSQAFLVFAEGDAGAVGELAKYATSGEEWVTIDGVTHLHCPNGLGRSKLGAKLAGATNVPTTTRNLRTITKLLELAGVRGK